MRLITLLLLSLVLIGCEKELPVFKGSPLEREGLFYAPNSTEPLTANVEEYYESGALERIFALIDGAKQGLEQSWYEKGQLKKEQTFVNGKQEGLSEGWRADEQLWRSFISVSLKARFNLNSLNIPRRVALFLRSQKHHIDRDRKVCAIWAGEKCAPHL